MSLNLSQQQIQTLRLTPQQILYTKLLQLPITQLEERLKEELEDNPLLETQDDSEEELTLSAEDGSAVISQDDSLTSPFTSEAPLSSSEDTLLTRASEDMPPPPLDSFKMEPGDEASKETPSSDDGMDHEIDIPDFWDDDDYPPTGSHAGREEDMPQAQQAYHPSAQDYLAQQLSYLELTEGEARIAEELIGNLEDDGYLRCELKDIQEGLENLGHLSTRDEIEAVLMKLQTLDPPGVAARSLQECLLLQVHRLLKEDERDDDEVLLLARQVLSQHYDDFSGMRFPKLQHDLDVNAELLREAIMVIKRLNPKPLSFETGEGVRYVVPDFQVSYDGTDLVLFHFDKHLPPLRLSKKYKHLLAEKHHSKETREWIKQKADSAKAFITALEMRRFTLQRVMEAIMTRQRAFFIQGPSELKPMLLKQIAEDTSLDISTISRVVRDKFVRTDYGVFELRSFFTTAMETESGDEISNRIIKQHIKDYIEKEEQGKPLSDDKLTDLLNTRGFKVARRTVAKYREELHIPVARLRRKM